MMELRDPLVETLRKFLASVAGYPIVAAVSGGVDSMAMLAGLVAAGQGEGEGLTVCHVHHGIRGDEADRDEATVAETARFYGLSYEVRWVDVPGAHAQTGESEEMAARRLRYAALEEVADHIGVCVILTAHHRRDQAETVMERILTGTSLSGLRGIAATRALGRHILARPLLSVTPEQIRLFAVENGVRYVEDSTNATVEYRRNRLRLELFPYLRAHFNGQVDDALLRLSEIAREDDLLLDDIARGHLTSIAHFGQESSQIALSSLAGLPIALQRRVIKLVLGKIDPKARFDYSRIEEIRAFVLRPAQGERSLGYGWKATCASGTLHIVKRSHIPDLQTCLWMPFRVGQSAFVSIPGLLWDVTAELVPPPQDYPVSLWEAYFAREGDALFLFRPWQVGDRIAPLGLCGTKLVSDVFMDAKVPKALRSQYPVLVIADKVAWVPGLCRSREYLLNGTETAVQRIAVQPHSECDLLQ